MGQSDHGHLSSHHSVRGGCDLVQTLEQHLPHAGQDAHRQGFGHGQPAGAFIGRNGRVLGGLRRDFNHGHPMGDLGQIAQDRHRVGPVCILPAQFGQSARRIAAHNHVNQIEHTATVRQP